MVPAMHSTLQPVIRSQESYLRNSSKARKNLDPLCSYVGRFAKHMRNTSGVSKSFQSTNNFTTCYPIKEVEKASTIRNSLSKIESVDDKEDVLDPIFEASFPKVSRNAVVVRSSFTPNNKERNVFTPYSNCVVKQASCKTPS